MREKCIPLAPVSGRGVSALTHSTDYEVEEAALVSAQETELLRHAQSIHHLPMAGDPVL